MSGGKSWELDISHSLEFLALRRQGLGLISYENQSEPDRKIQRRANLRKNKKSNTHPQLNGKADADLYTCRLRSIRGNGLRTTSHLLAAGNCQRLFKKVHEASSVGIHENKKTAVLPRVTKMIHHGIAISMLKQNIGESPAAQWQEERASPGFCESLDLHFGYHSSAEMSELQTEPSSHEMVVESREREEGLYSLISPYRRTKRKKNYQFPDLEQVPPGYQRVIAPVAHSSSSTGKLVTNRLHHGAMKDCRWKANYCLYLGAQLMDLNTRSNDGYCGACVSISSLDCTVQRLEGTAMPELVQVSNHNKFPKAVIPEKKTQR
ncbi:hypothetical protein AC579_6960 [Pseudocercospora musae]|uniref:Uncharacterized protein n=1 Tax=Pseudocercospora musae TaxID=113226 RepID=A0A139INV1_9PEZI|nr:hypothetical protein AC579_6960 [Pseudocercospora musae]